MLIIKIFKDENKIPETFKIEKYPCCIGRSKLNDIVIDSDAISVNHCKIVEEKHHFVLKDLESTNKLVHEGKQKESHIIDEGDIIQLGDISIVFHIENEEHEKTKAISILPVKHGLKEYLISSETRREIMVVLPFLLFCFLYHWIFNYNYEFKNVLQDYLIAFGAITPCYFALAVISKIVNGIFQWRRAFDICVMLYTIIYAWNKLSDKVYAYIVGQNVNTVLSLLSTFILGVFIIYHILGVITLRTRKKVIFYFSLIILFSFTVTGLLVEYYIEDKDHHSLSSSISYPLFNYSVSTNSCKKLWDEMGDNFIKIEKMRAEEIAERKKYFD